MNIVWFRPWEAERARRFRAAMARRGVSEQMIDGVAVIMGTEMPSRDRQLLDEHHTLPPFRADQAAEAVVVQARRLFPYRRVSANELRAMVRRGLRP